MDTNSTISKTIKVKHDSRITLKMFIKTLIPSHKFVSEVAQFDGC